MAWEQTRKIPNVPTPIELADLAEGAHQVEVIGQNFAGVWQEESDAAGRQWVVGAGVAGRQLFYNNSAWDGNGTAVPYAASGDDSSPPV